MKYTDSHEWIKPEGKKGTIGITNHAQKELGEIVYVELPSVGKQIQAGEEIAVVESTKAAADIYSPVSGTISKINTWLKEDVSLLNGSPESEGWLVEIELSDPEELKTLLDLKAYQSQIS